MRKWKTEKVIVQCDIVIYEILNVDNINKKKANALAMPIDMSSCLSIKKAINEIVSIFGNIEVLVCAHGVADYNILIDDKEENISEVLNRIV